MTNYIEYPIDQYPSIKDVWITMSNRDLSPFFTQLDNTTWIAGGALVRALEGSYPYASDIDIYPENHPRNRFTGLKENGWKRTVAAYNKMFDAPHIKVSIMDFSCRNIRYALEYFDLVHCRIATNGEVVVTTEETLDCIYNKKLRFTGTSPPPWDRITKYNKRGYEFHDEDVQQLVDYITRWTTKNIFTTKDDIAFVPPKTNYRTIMQNIDRVLDYIAKMEALKHPTYDGNKYVFINREMQAAFNEAAPINILDIRPRGAPIGNRRLDELFD